MYVLKHEWSLLDYHQFTATYVSGIRHYQDEDTLILACGSWEPENGKSSVFGVFNSYPTVLTIQAKLVGSRTNNYSYHWPHPEALDCYIYLTVGGTDTWGSQRGFFVCGINDDLRSSLVGST